MDLNQLPFSESRCWCGVATMASLTKSKLAIHKIVTLLWLHGHGGEHFEVWDDVSPFGKPGGLAMRGRVRNWASFETPNGKPMFRMKSQPDPDFTPEQRAPVAKAAGVVVSCDAVSRDTHTPGCASSPSDGPSTPRWKVRPLRAFSPLPRRKRRDGVAD